MSANEFRPIKAEAGSGILYIGGVDEIDAEQCAENGAGVVLLSARPEYYGALLRVLEINPDIPIYATAASLRSIKEILNRKINERLIKNSMVIDGYEFRIRPSVSWIDSVEVYKGGELVISEPEETAERDDIEVPAAFIAYASRYGFTKRLAETAAAELSDTYNVILKNAYEMTADDYRLMNSADILLIGTHTINRNAPECVWKLIASLDAARKRGMNYLVFGSYGWAGDAIGLINSALKEMGMRPVSKPVRALFNPNDDDIETMSKMSNIFKKITK